MVTGAGGSQQTRPFLSGRFAFVVRTTTSEDRDLVEALFRDLPAPATGVSATDVFLLRDGDLTTPSWEVAGPRLEPVVLSNLEGALSLIVSAVNIAALDSEPEYLHLHASLAIKEGRSVIIAADADTGKSTTVALLATRGWGYGSDETVRLPNRESDPITGFVKPVSVKPGGHADIEHWEQWMVPPPHGGPEDFRFVPVGDTGATVAAGGRQHLLVLLRRPGRGESECGPVVKRIHPADAVVALMQQTLDAERFGPAALRLAELAAANHCFDVIRGTPLQTVEEIERLFELDPVEPLELVALPSSPALGPGVISILIDDRVVVHERNSGRIFALDAGGTRVWRKLGQWCDDDDVDLDGPVVRAFVEELRALGVLADAP